MNENKVEIVLRRYSYAPDGSCGDIKYSIVKIENEEISNLVNKYGYKVIGNLEETKNAQCKN